MAYLPNLMEKIFGKNWRTTCCGILTAICTYIIGYPQILEPLSPYWQNTIRNLVVFIMGSGIVLWGRAGRDNKVSEEKNQEFTRKIQNIKK